MAKVLVVGGAGYVGSAACAYLKDQGHRVWVLDNLSTGHSELALGDGLTVASAGDAQTLQSLLQSHSFDCAMHFAAKSLVPESFQKPDEYRQNNVQQTQILLETLLEAGVKNFIFSSSCAIFGDPGEKRIDESLPKKPISPYGENKLEAERRIEALTETHGLRAVTLRYFNAAGAEPQNRVGEWHENESHLIPRILAAAQKHQSIQVFGEDYPTPDGTCIRDYVHVWDLAEAHAQAMSLLLKHPAHSKGVFKAYNLGSEKGFSVKEVIEAARRVSGAKLPIQIQPRREGDPARLVADSALARKELGFSPKHSAIDPIVSSAWKWQLKLEHLREKK